MVKRIAVSYGYKAIGRSEFQSFFEMFGKHLRCRETSDFQGCLEGDAPSSPELWVAACPRLSK
jgi:hypothetical protein